MTDLRQVYTKLSLVRLFRKPNGDVERKVLNDITTLIREISHGEERPVRILVQGTAVLPFSI